MIPLLVSLFITLTAPLPCSSWELQEDASLICDGTTYQEGEYALTHDADDGDIVGASAYRATCDERDSVSCQAFEVRR